MNLCLDRLFGFAYFKPSGALKARLTEEALRTLEEAPSAGELVIEASIGKPEKEGEATLSFRVAHDDQTSDLAIDLARLTDAELDDLVSLLDSFLNRQETGGAVAAGPSGPLDAPEGDHHDHAAAAARLKVSPEWLKSVVPCSDYTYEEIEGKKYIRDYFWSKELIERLVKIKSSKTTPEDLQFVASECCYGDTDWAKDLIARLKSPNRPEAAPKEQKVDTRFSNAKVATPKAGRPGPQKGGTPAAPQGGGQPKGGQNRGGAEKEGQEAKGGQPAPGGANAANPGQKERGRRSRHRRRFRHGKGEGAKQESGESKPKE
ncbi:hypothetical protein L4X63_16210 [Geomonas sp. Red32]|uniref:hypothetical protein n=1 Tax=Geomonas sp. Red32 TaxID=2912856 RepID=UPI00202CEB63|nr:hypothetical protein [Geomonas sp. Red32]